MLKPSSVLGGLLFMLSSATPAESSAHTDWKPFTFTSGVGDTLSADSTRVEVPENRLHPTGRAIQLLVVRIRSTAARPGAPIIYLAGGPGGAGVSGARGELFTTVAALRTISDVILFDQRGTGQTLPSMLTRRTIGAPLDESSTSQAAKVAAVANSRAALEEVRARGNDPTAYNTVENADDIEEVRKAVGAERLIVWGHSYGSHLGLSYLRRHPNSVERAILGGINGPDHRRRFPMDGDVLFRRLDSIVKATPSLRAVMPDFFDTAKRVLDRLAASPAIAMVDSQRVLVSREDVQVVIALQSGEQSFVRRLPQLVGEMDAGNFSTMARFVRDGLKNRPLGTVMTYMTDLASGASEERMKKIGEQVPNALLGDAINFPFDDPDFQAAWNAPDLGASFRAPIQSRVPTMFISGTLDGRTSLGDADEVRRGFATHANFVVVGASHNIYAATPALLDAMLRFAKGERLKDTVLSAPHVELRSADEALLTGKLRAALSSGGPSAAANTLRLAAANGSGHHVTSAYVNDLVIAYARNNMEAASAFLAVGLDLFPWSSPLLTRKAQGAAAAGDRATAMTAYRAALAQDPFNQVAKLELRRLEQAP